MAQASDVLAVAVKEIGTVEQIGNRQKYGKAYGMDGVYWCMQFVWWCFQQVDKSLFMDGGKTASCGELMRWAQAHGQWVTTGYRPGDVLIYDFPGTAYKTCAVTVILLKDNFADNDWASIIAACHSGSVLSTWVVGNSKTMTINGTSYQIDIIGKNHDTYTSGGTAPLTFQMHDCYADMKAMNSSFDNYGGWKNSEMRTTHLPAILALMPTEVQNGIREVSKKASVGGESTTIETVSDKLFLLSEVEIFGSIKNSAAGEGTQYDYYKAGNSKVKKLNGSATYWWERSPYASSSSYFCGVWSSGNASYDGASGNGGVAFGFCF